MADRSRRGSSAPACSPHCRPCRWAQSIRSGPQKEQLATIDTQVMAALGAKGYPGRWPYAITNGNPSEVLAEIFTALLNDPIGTIATTLPPGLAAVYLAYGGHRSGDINSKLARIFPGGVPTIAKPQDALALI